MHNENWDDLRFVLAVAESGSVLQAARHLGVNHATVLRRVAAFEERHNTTLFERTARGYHLLPDRAHVIRAAQSAEAALMEVNRLAIGGQITLRGTVKVTSTDTLCATILPRFVVAMQAEQQDLGVSLLSSNTYLDLLRETTTLTVRPSPSLPDDMVGDIATELAFAAYAVDHSQTEWLTLSGPLSRSIAAKWVDENIKPTKRTIAADSFLTLREIAALGRGIAVLPCFVGDPDGRLTRLDDIMPRLAVPVWVARHADAVETQQMRAVQSRLIQFLSEQRSLPAS